MAKPEENPAMWEVTKLVDRYGFGRVTSAIGQLMQERFGSLVKLPVYTPDGPRGLLENQQDVPAT